jgi:hypothetical protein
VQREPEPGLPQSRQGIVTSMQRHPLQTDPLAGATHLGTTKARVAVASRAFDSGFRVGENTER